MINIGRTVKKLRTQSGITQRELAARAQLSPSFLSLVENERRRPSLAVIRRLAGALSLPEEVLIWDAVELPDNLDQRDRRLCQIAKLIVRRYYESAHAQALQG